LLNDGDLHPVVRKPRPAGKPPHPAANYDRIKSVTHLSLLSFHSQRAIALRETAPPDPHVVSNRIRAAQESIC
jgi:hypothetical protein